MLTMNELADLRMQQQIAHEIYRHQIMQRIPDPFPAAMLPLHDMPNGAVAVAAAAAAAAAAHQMLVPPRPELPGCEAKLENNDLWQQFHKIGTEMIITKSGRRMFPSMRVSFAGLEEDSNYCVLLEMVPIGDCRYKFSGSQWVPAGGAEPQSPQRMYLHPDSPATGTHWQSQATLFNKVKLTNNTLDSSGHIVLASMHKYQPRLHIIRTSDLTQLPWAPQQSFVFPETEFVAVTAYQNDRITKLKIDNNPFAKGFRETGQSRCKRKLTTTFDQQPRNRAQEPTLEQEQLSSNGNGNGNDNCSEDDRISVCSVESPPQTKRVRCTLLYGDDEGCFTSSSSSGSSGSISPHFDDPSTKYRQSMAAFYQHQQQQQYQQDSHYRAHGSRHLLQQQQQQLPINLSSAYFVGGIAPAVMPLRPLPALIEQHQQQYQHQQHLQHPHTHHQYHPAVPLYTTVPTKQPTEGTPASPLPSATASATIIATTTVSVGATTSPEKPTATTATPPSITTKRNNFSISAILAY